jgi:hypothetical protein
VFCSLLYTSNPSFVILVATIVVPTSGSVFGVAEYMLIITAGPVINVPIGKLLELYQSYALEPTDKLVIPLP